MRGAEGGGQEGARAGGGGGGGGEARGRIRSLNMLRMATIYMPQDVCQVGSAGGAGGTEWPGHAVPLKCKHRALQPRSLRGVIRESVDR